MKSTIAIIGATGEMGSALAHELAKAGYPLLLMGREKDKLNALADEMKRNGSRNIETTICAKDAAWEADVIIPAVPYEDQDEMIAHIKDVATGKIVISIINYLIDENAIKVAEELQQMLPYSKIVKVYNTVSTDDLEQTFKTIVQDCVITGNDPFAVETVSKMVKDAGFTVLIAESLNSKVKKSKLKFI